MKTIPVGMQPYKRTATFNQDSVPAALRRRHDTKPGAWAKIVVVSGKLKYRILSDPIEEVIVSPEQPGIVEETVPHEVEPVGPVVFYLEFYKMPETTEAAVAREMDRELGDGGKP